MGRRTHDLELTSGRSKAVSNSAGEARMNRMAKKRFFKAWAVNISARKGAGAVSAIHLCSTNSGHRATSRAVTLSFGRAGSDPEPSPKSVAFWTERLPVVFLVWGGLHARPDNDEPCHRSAAREGIQPTEK
mgnify:CR=1 FL=1